MINCIAIDDEPLGLMLLEAYCAQFKEISLLKSFTNLSEAISFLSKNEVDLLFLDVQMPDMNGIDFFKTYGVSKMVIFTTAYSEYAIDGFNLNAVDYLLKPFDYERFSLACQKATRIHQNKQVQSDRNVQFITVKSEYKIMNLAVDRIVYIESKDDYVKLFLNDGKFLMSKITTRGMLSKLPDSLFIQIHRSYIVNKNYIQSVSATQLVIQQKEFPIGKKFKENVQANIRE
jgi:DNA-binding LytR/AlgR family response regulator